MGKGKQTDMKGEKEDKEKYARKGENELQVKLRNKVPVEKWNLAYRKNSSQNCYRNVLLATVNTACRL